MDGVKPVQKWTDGAGNCFDTEDQAIQSQARRIIRNIVCDAVDFERKTVDVESLHDRRNSLYDALRKIRKGE